MNAGHAFSVLAEAAERERTALAGVSREVIRRRSVSLMYEEIRASARLAGASLQLGDVTALVERGIAHGSRPLQEYIVTADYADAARFVSRAQLPGPRQPFLTTAEIVELHALATRRTSPAPGKLRTTTFPAFPNGMVPPPPWLLQIDLSSFTARLAAGPPAGMSPLYWAAAAHERFERIHPFSSGNGRVGRLLLNLLLHRCGYPPFAVRDRDVERYLEALRSADSENLWPLATMVARSVLASLLRLAEEETIEDLRSLASFASGSERQALYKAAQRGRLRTVRDGRGLQTRQAWIDAYRASCARRHVTAAHGQA
jgi:Fic family protein